MDAVEKCAAENFDAVIRIRCAAAAGRFFPPCKAIKKQKDIPILMLSARGEEYDKLFGFEMGG